MAALGGTGVFSQISPQFGAVKEGVTLTFRMVSNPVIHKVTFEGNTVFSDDELRQILAVPKDSVLNFVQVSRNIKAIDDLYVQQGYILASRRGNRLISSWQAAVWNDFTTSEFLRMSI